MSEQRAKIALRDNPNDSGMTLEKKKINQTIALTLRRLTSSPVINPPRLKTDSSLGSFEFSSIGAMDLLRRD